jgi:hypothetical protein
MGWPLQMRRAGVSTAANIGDYYLILTQDLSYGQTQRLMISLDETGRLLHSYAAAILSSVS